ncbi:glycosyltransferase family 4 protein [Microbulbifer pacificus]|uniref:Glycosyltransferase family 4 protein n=1 Tax=Microbulbifer pacificus TaxID=407164 RepID=A0AAU0MWG0_9GAMM|nr:glycosyltransferase family 4 protein [Microbulbifer pacificus]WOX04838.1 glycosyltransferase family 4 protein [Microbulbifer pacificus]
MTKVLMVTAQYMPDVYGGAEKQCRRIATELQSSGVEVTVLTSTQKWRVDESNESLKVKRIYTLFPPDLLGRWLFFSIYWLVAATCWAIWNRNKFDIIHCHQGKFGAFVGCFIGKLLNKPTIIKIGNSNQHMDLVCLKKKFFIGPILVRLILKSNPVFVAITSVIAENLKKFGCKRIVCIPNGIDTALLNSLSPKKTRVKKTDSIILFYHGRIEEIKRIDILLRAFEIVFHSDFDLKLHLVGDGTALVETKRWAQKLGLQDSIVFHGAREDVIEVISHFDVFVNASEAEGFSNSLLEALLLGKVLVSTPVSGASDVIEDGKNGAVAENFSPERLAEAILMGVKVYKEHAGAVIDHNKNLVTEKFRMPLVAEKYKNLYGTLGDPYKISIKMPENTFTEN